MYQNTPRGTSDFEEKQNEFWPQKQLFSPVISRAKALYRIMVAHLQYTAAG